MTAPRSHLPDLLKKNIKIGIVTAAGYTTADRYHERLHGLLDAMAASTDLSAAQKQSLVIMGGEANYLFEFSADSPHLLAPVPREQWLTAEMASWSEPDIKNLLDAAEAALGECVRNMNLPATLVRKDRAVGIVPRSPDVRIPRESLEETVLVVQKILELGALGLPAQTAGGRPPPPPGSALAGSGAARAAAAAYRGSIPFCAFNGGRDVFVDIGDKSWGVTVCQRWFGRRAQGSADGYGRAASSSASSPDARAIIAGENTLHVGDQFLSAGSNDFKARSVGTTAWIASPGETVELLDELTDLMGKKLS